jgi:hypothetical protein
VTATAPDRSTVADQAAVDTAIATLRGELGRCDSKASLLLALTGASLAGVVSAAASAHLPVASVAVGAVGAAGLLAATVILLLAVRPSLSGAGWPTWPRLPVEQLREHLAAGQQVDEVKVLAANAARKFRRIRYAVDCILAGLGFLALAAVLAAVG